MPHGHADLGQPTPQSIFYDQGRFGRLFPTLPAFAADTKFVRDALLELGAKGGPMDAGDICPTPSLSSPTRPRASTTRTIPRSPRASPSSASSSTTT